jgi:hypothetical protein
MNRPTNTALKIAAIALALSGLGGALTGCGGSDSDGDGSAADAPKDASKDGFCEKLTGLSAAVAKADPEDTSAAINALKDWIGEMEDYGTPSELSGEARGGFEVLIATFKGVDEDASMEDLQKLGTDASAADTKKVEAFSAWTSENCTPATTPSDDAS